MCITWALPCFEFCTGGALLVLLGYRMVRGVGWSGVLPLRGFDRVMQRKETFQRVLHMFVI